MSAASMSAAAMTTLMSAFVRPGASRGESGGARASEVLLRGLTGKCPNCGRGRMFSRFLKVADHCPVCGEELSHHRADDFPAYLVIVLVGHIVVPLALTVEIAYAPAIWVQYALWLPLTLGLSLGLLQPVKGAVVALQWAGGMHGFARAYARRHGLPVPEPGEASI
jgi:uncharacterized protein (DUF983 family)